MEITERELVFALVYISRMVARGQRSQPPCDYLSERTVGRLMTASMMKAVSIHRGKRIGKMDPPRWDISHDEADQLITEFTRRLGEDAAIFSEDMQTYQFSRIAWRMSESISPVLRARIQWLNEIANDIPIDVEALV